MKTSEHLAQIEFRHKLRLPPAYRAFLESHDRKIAYAFRGFRGEAWRLHSAFEPDAPVSNIKPRPLKFELVAKAAGRSLSGAVTIGSENTTQLYIDTRSGNSVWLFHLDDQTTERVADSFEQWLGKAQRV